MDPAYLLDMTGGDRVLVREIMGDFLRSDAEDRRMLEMALGAGNARDVHTYAHRIKGAARAIGADDYAELAQRIESGASGGSDLRPDFESLQAAASALSAWTATFE